MAKNDNKTVKVRYVGKKPWTIDSIAGTSISWDGRGSVRDVPAEAWKKLMLYPDQWQLDDGMELPTDSEIETTLASLQAKANPINTLNPSEMSKMELVEYAMKKHDLELGVDLTKDEMLAKLDDVENNERIDEENKARNEVVNNEFGAQAGGNV